MWFCYVIFVAWFALSNCEESEDGCINLGSGTFQKPKPKQIAVVQNGYLYSPGFKENKNYPDSIYCVYHLKAPRGMHIRLHFNYLDVKVSDACEEDMLAIFDYDSEKSQSTLIGQYCGHQSPADIVTESNSAQVVLRTNYFSSGKGFNISYSMQINSSVCSAGLKQCINRNCVPQHKICNGFDDCGDGTDEEKCSPNYLEVHTLECGKTDIDPILNANFDRIVGGQVAIPGSWPWMADLQARYIEPNGHVCGGVLINEQWVLSAAHCFEEKSMRVPSGWRIHLGNYRKFERDEYEQIRYPERIVMYNIPSDEFEKTGRYHMLHDVALIKLNAPVNITKHVKPICLPEPNTKLDLYSDCFAIGWGQTAGSGGSDVLKQAFFPVQPDVLCRRLVGDEFQASNMLCAGSMAPYNGVCHGDSGGPLMCKIDNTWSVHGVASYVTQTNLIGGICGVKGRPSVFNKVEPKDNWIYMTVERYSS